MNITGRITAVARDIALWSGLGVAILFVALICIGFAIASFYMWMSHLMAHSLAALATAGAGLVLIALMAVVGGLIIRKTKKRQPSMMEEFSNTVGLGARLISVLVRRDPRKAMIVSLVAGALAELVTSDRRK
jgi:hypothetical protein